MVITSKTITLDFSNPKQVKTANEKYKNINNMLNSVNQDGEEQLISFGNDKIVLTTFQKNGWTRKNYYSAESGELEGEAFEDRWK